MKKLPVILGAILALSACAAPPDSPTITTNDAQLFSTDKDVIVRGISGPNGLRPPLLVRRTYPITCARDPLMDPPRLRAAETIRQINAILGPVTNRSGESYFKAEEMRQVNQVTVPSLKCSIGYFTETQISRDPNVIAAFAAKNGVALSGQGGGF